MKIATYVDEGGNIVNAYEHGRILLHDDSSGTWQVVREIPFAVNLDMTLSEVKATIRAAVAQLDDCRTFLSGEVRGLIYSLLQEENGFRVWKVQGPAGEQLDVIARRDADLARQREKEAAERAFAAAFSSPTGGCGCGGGGGRKRSAEAARAVRSMAEALGDGHYRINLADILARYRDANSMDVLVPLMEGTRFDSLEILCDHLPRWFDAKLRELNMEADIQPSGRGVKALVFPRRTAEQRP